jgi:predicted TIM-barrel fold metal-dependent hydrolase
MNIVDFHTHVFPDDLAARAIEKLRSNSPESVNHTDGTAAGLISSMKKNGISHSVLLPIATKPSQVDVINQTCTTQRSDHFIPFGTIHPSTEKPEEVITFLKNNGIKGIKLHPEYQDFYITDPKLFPIYEQLAAEKIVLLFHAGKDPGPFTCDHALPSAMRTICKQFPDLTIVAAHLGGWKVWDDVEHYLCGLPLYFDTSAVSGLINPAQFTRIVQKHGAEHILFGTDSPWFDQGDSLRWHLKLPLSDSDKECILGKNASRLLNL